jgi:bacillithiol system protein YtxJ
MSLLKKLFGTNNLPKEPKKIIPWNRLTDINQLNELDKESYHQPIAIFKHSTRCGTSSMALRQFEKQLNTDNNNHKIYFLDLLSFRELSNEIAIRFQVFHQSPQLIVIKNGNTIHHSSHYQIDAKILNDIT